MSKMRISTIAGAVTILAILALPANAAADELEDSLQTCSACHGQNGEPIAPIIPIIWGQQESYLVKQIHDYKSKDRDNPIMSPLTESIKQPDIRKVARYFAGKTWPVHQAAAAAAASPPNGTAICKVCHQENFQGGLPAPRLAGQSYEYLLGAMNGFADEQRTNSIDMMKLMKALTPAQRQEIARYLSAL
jgi:cytochrome c553